jgi:hypothetical protein
MHKLVRVLDNDCTCFDETIFTHEEFFIKKFNVHNPRSWNMNRFEYGLSLPIRPINKNEAFSDFECKIFLYKN